MPQEIALRPGQPPSSKAVDQRLQALLPQSVASGLRERWVDRYGSDGGWDGELAGYTLPDNISAQDRNAAILVVSQALVPCPPENIEGELLRMRVSTKSRLTDEDEIVAQFSVYAALCERYPVDVVIEALRYIGENEVFWPALAEVKAALERRVKRRRLLLEALERLAQA